ncbi:hypothetical protein [Undibacterium sp. TS12]|uniref:hypothetical protein n=1 Tax=Undibacterium sp. TS12 TaxID=2908202 RepID=UPI001F4CC728|nr:hypothetical protein [Undibacterium sp. TS12]MCH8620754.1 hypothetical protein [Undibacterium sp. TS12]
MNGSIFQLLFERAANENVIIQNADKSRYITKISDEDSELLSDAKLSALLLGRKSRIVQIEHREETYFCLFDFPEPDVPPEGIEATPLTPALFTCAVLEAKVLSNATGSEIKNAIESDFIDNAGYAGHKLDVITPLFPTVLAYKGSVYYEYQHDLQRITGSFIARTLDNLQIELERTTIESLIDFFEAGPRHIPYANIVRGMMTLTWEGLFLDTYRCIEQIYSCTKVAALKNDWASNKPLRQLAELLETHLSWRPKEEDALIAILEKCDKASIKEACILLRIPTEETVHVDGQETVRPRTDEKLAKSVAGNIYSIRNNLVHYRPIHEMVKKNDSEWNCIIRLMLKLVREAYELFGPSFFEDGISAIPIPPQQEVTIA